MSRRLTVTASLVLTGAGLGFLGGIPAPASAASARAPSITASPDNLMVNTETTLTGRHFARRTTVQIVECSQTLWVVPAHPCDTNNALSVTTGANGGFRTKMKVEICPGTATPASGGLSQRCFIGVPHPTGVDTVALRPHTAVIVTYP